MKGKEQMDSSEKVAFEFLTLQGFGDILFEPDGNITPDFKVEGALAVEVRRLNQNDFTGGKPEGFEQADVSLWKGMKNLMSNVSFDSNHNESWTVTYRFTRPIGPWKTLRGHIKVALEDFYKATNKVGGVIFSVKGFDLYVAKSHKRYSDAFVLGGSTDKDASGFLLSKFKRNLDYCIREKTKKIASRKYKYDRWWLILVDYIGYGLNEFEQELFKDCAEIEHEWDRIILIDPRDPSRWFEV